MTSVFNNSPNLIHHFTLGKMNLQNERKIKQVRVIRLIPGLQLFLFQEYEPIGPN